MRPTRFSHQGQRYLLVSPFDVRTVSDPEVARTIARSLLANDADWVATPDDKATGAEEERLMAAILSGELRFVEVERESRVLDHPRIVERILVRRISRVGPHLFQIRSAGRRRGAG